MADEQQATEVSETAEAFSDESVDTDVGAVEETAAPEQAGGSQASEEPSGFADVNEESAETTDEASEQDSTILIGSGHGIAVAEDMKKPENKAVKKKSIFSRKKK